MKNKIAFVTVYFFIGCLYAQKSPTAVSPVIIDTSAAKPNAVAAPQISTTSIAVKSPYEEEDHIENPNIGLGVGVLSFHGDINSKISQSLLSGRTASELTVTQRFSDCFSINFNVLFGKLGANERFAPDNRNANVESEIRAGSVSLVYDFGNYLPPGRNATPFISLGVSGFEFLSKTDLKDKNGNTYYYWSDGTIRNIDQNASNASDAVLLKRDYTYESDVRNTTLKQYGKYSEHSFAIPFGIGFSFRINNFITFRISNTMYYTFTDKIDGIVHNNPNRIVAGFKNDNFMMTSCGISYNFRYKRTAVAPEIEGFKNPYADFNRIDKEDKDKDGVPDLIDSSQGTPEGVVVDTLGRPLDEDKDAIPDYRDKEKASPAGAIVSPKGKVLSDEEIADMYEHYMNTTMKYAGVGGMEAINAIEEDKFFVNVGTYDNNDSTIKLPALVASDSSLIKIKLTESKSIYLIGNYNYLDDAEKRKTQLMSQGIDSAKVMIKQNGAFSFVAPTLIVLPKSETKTEVAPEVTPNPSLQNTVPANTATPVKTIGESFKAFVEKLKHSFKPKQKAE
jgi:hypothetical protein